MAMPGHRSGRRVAPFASCLLVALGLCAATPVGGASTATPNEKVPTFQPTGPGSIQGLAADGGRAAVIVGSGHGCASVQAWEPARRRGIRLQRACGTHDDVSNLEATQGIALAGTRAAWLH